MFKKEEERESKRKRGRERGLCEWPLAVFNLIRTTKSVYVNRQQFKIINWIHKNHSRRKMLRWMMKRKKKMQDSWPVFWFFICLFYSFYSFTFYSWDRRLRRIQSFYDRCFTIFWWNISAWTWIWLFIG